MFPVSGTGSSGDAAATAVSEEEPHGLVGTGLEEEGEMRRSSASPRSCSPLDASLGLAPPAWDGHLKLPSRDGAEVAQSGCHHLC